MSFDDGRMEVVDEFIYSYSSLGKKLKMTSSELGNIIDEFSFDDGKFSVLRKLHMFILDRDNLKLMIESEFNRFDQEKALRIVRLEK